MYSITPAQSRALASCAALPPPLPQASSPAPHSLPPNTPPPPSLHPSPRPPPQTPTSPPAPTLWITLVGSTPSPPLGPQNTRVTSRAQLLQRPHHSGLHEVPRPPHAVCSFWPRPLFWVQGRHWGGGLQPGGPHQSHMSNSSLGGEGDSWWTAASSQPRGKPGTGAGLPPLRPRGPTPPPERAHRMPRCPLACHRPPCAGPLGTGSLACRQTLGTGQGRCEGQEGSRSPPSVQAAGGPHSPNHACWSPCTSMARPKSASFTAAPLHLLARSRFSGCREGNTPVRVRVTPQGTEGRGHSRWDGGLRADTLPGRSCPSRFLVTQGGRGELSHPGRKFRMWQADPRAPHQPSRQCACRVPHLGAQSRWGGCLRNGAPLPTRGPE